MSNTWLIYGALALSAWLFIAVKRSRIADGNFAYPPGPKPLPLLGNLFHLPRSSWWIKFTDLGERFGPILHLSAANRHIVVIKSHEIAKELLDGVGTADRPQFLMAGDLMGFGISVVLIGYGERWRTYRRISHQVMSTTAVRMYHDMQEQEAKRMVRAILLDPEAFREQLRFSSGRTIMDAIYGIDCATPDNTYITVAEATLNNVTHALIPGSFVIDAVPWLRYLPYIGLPFQKHVRIGKKQVDLMVQRPFQHVLRNRERETAKPSFTSSLLDGEIRLAETAERDDIVSWAAATMYAAAGETTLATLLNFFLAMTQNPHVQRKAQAEIDSVVGGLRCPSFADKANLPYVNALIKELTRWRVALPMGLPHTSREDTQYKEYFIPKGTIFMPNVWSISRDPAYYENPHVFNPGRFLKEEPELDPFGYVFGFGPRTCVGKNFAINQLFIFITSLLWAVEIAAVDNEVIPNPEYTSGFVSAPMPFPCKITPRHSTVEELTSLVD